MFKLKGHNDEMGELIEQLKREKKSLEGRWYNPKLNSSLPSL